MTRPTARRRLHFAPELAVLHVLDAALRMAHAALHAEHPTLAGFVSPDEPPALARARRLAHDLVVLRRRAGRYRADVTDAIEPSLPPEDDLPF
jgi:hypothetical protein